MKFSDVLKMSFKDLRRRKGRTFLTSIAIAIGTMLIVTMVGLGTTAENFILNQFKKYGEAKIIQVAPMKQLAGEEENKTNQMDMSQEERKEEQEKMFKKIDDKDIDIFKNLSNVAEVNGQMNVDGLDVEIDGKNNKIKNGISINSFDNNGYLFNNDEIEQVRKKEKNNSIEPIVAGRILKNSDINGVLVNEKLLKSMGISDYKSIIGKSITLIKDRPQDENINIEPLKITAEIIGIVNKSFEKEASNTLITNIGIANKIKSYSTLKNNYFEEKGYDNILIYANGVSDVKNIGKELEKLGYAYFSQDKLAENIKSSLVTVEQILSILGLIVLIVAAIGTMNTMTMVIQERTKSIGIMKSIGASRRDIHNMFLTQSAVIGAIGGIIGIGFSLINSKIIQIILQSYLNKQGIDENISFSMPIWLVLGTLAFSIIISLVSGIYPARKASKLDAVQALNA